MAKKKTTVEIPLHLARLLIVEKEDLKDPTQYEDIQELAKTLLKVLVTAGE